MLHADIVILGGGPVGLLLACLLARRGLPVRVLEAEASIPQESRAIGIHPPGLDALAAAGVADEVITQGVRVRQGVVHLRGRQRAVRFDKAHGTYGFVLSVPQRLTTMALERRLQELAPDALRRERRVTALLRRGPRHELTVESPDGVHTMQADLVLACDGAHSLVAKAAGLAHEPMAAGPAYVMADVPDTTSLGDDAHLFLGDAPVVESFPLPGDRRRWVVGIGRERAADDRAAQAALVERLVRERTGHVAPAAEAVMVSAFTAEQHMAPCLVRDGVVLAGDAAHAISPIGGQGMSLGWLDTLALAAAVPDAAALSRYDRRRRAAARTASARASLFMWLGTPLRHTALRDLTLALLLAPGVRTHTAKVIAMRGLG
ncbi:MAG: FAD-dependent oxidoreductase [Vicinamibacterales bacterium]